MLIPPLEIFKKSGQIFKANFGPFSQITAWLLIPALLLGLLGYLDTKAGATLSNYSVPFYLLFTALAFVLGLWVNIVLRRLIFSIITQKTVDRKKEMSEAWRDTISYLWVSILVGAVTLLGYLLFLIPGLIFTIWYSFAATIFVLEGSRGSAALTKSKALVAGRFWEVTWRWVVPYFFYILILIVLIGAPTLLMGWLTNFSGLTYQTQPWWFNFWQSIVAIITLPLGVGFGVILYHNLKENA